MKSLLLSLILILSTNFSYAQNAILLEKGDIAPFKGALITPDKVSELVKAKKSELVLRDIAANQKLQLNEYESELKVLTKDLKKEKVSGTINIVASFIVGVIATAFIYEVKQ